LVVYLIMDELLLPKIKEKLSETFISGIASRNGFTIKSFDNDNGIDLEVERLEV